MVKDMPEKRMRKKKPRPIKPIKDWELMQAVKLHAQEMGEQPYMLILIGLNTGLRIGDILQLHVGDFRDGERLRLFEEKTGKHTDILLHPAVLADVRRMTKKRRDDELLFPSPQARKKGEPISYVTAYRWVKEACRRAGIEKYAGCHTMRKTFGFMKYQETRNVALLMKRFHHSRQEITLRYIGVDDDEMDKLAKKAL